MVITLTQTKLRPFTLEDAPATVELFNAYSQHHFGYEDCNLDDMLNDWTSPGVELEETVRVVEDACGSIIGYIDVWDTTNPHVIKYVWGILHPDKWDEDRYRDMLSWAESCARDRINLAPPNTRVVINHGTPSNDFQRNKALESYGYQLVRNFYRMMIEFDQPIPEPVLPEGLKIMPINLETELEDALMAMDEAFQDHWGHVKRPLEELLEQWHHHIENSKNFDPTLWFLAKDGDQIAGICRCSDVMIEDPDLAWVNQLCVRKPWRRQGLGLALLQTSFHAFYRRGKKRAGLGVDASSLTNATRLYEKAGMQVTEKYNTYELELRSGQDLMMT